MAVVTGELWFSRNRTAARPRSRLVILPHAGGTATAFHDWALLPEPAADVEVLVTRYPGRQERLGEPCLDRMEPLADAVTEALLPFTDVPFALFGHSMGASVAYEVALRMESLERPPAGLYVSGRAAPHRLVPKQTYLAGDSALLAEVRRLGGTDAAVLEHPELLELVLPALRADFAIVGTYGPVPAHPVHCPVGAYSGDSDPEVSRTEIEAWADVAPAGFAVTELPGGHFYLAEQRESVLQDLAERIG